MKDFILRCLSFTKSPSVLCVCGSCGGGKTETVSRATQACEHEMRHANKRRIITHYFNCVDVEPKALGEMITKACARGQRQSAHLDHLLHGLENVRTCRSSAKRSTVDVEPACPRFPLHLLVLDEADALRGFASGTTRSFLHNLVLFAIANPHYVALILVSNSRNFDVVPEKSRCDILFEAYTAQTLRQIAAEKSCTSAIVSDAALDFAAKTAVANHGGDVRQLTTIVRHSGKIASAKRPREENALQPTSVNVQHMAQASHSTSFHTMSILRTLPEQMLFVLSCCVYLLRQKGASGSKVHTLFVRDVSMLYKTIMTAKNFPVVPQQGINDLLMNLADYGLITRPQSQTFTLSTDAGLLELEGELIAVGASSQPNRLKEVLSFHS